MVEAVGMSVVTVIALEEKEDEQMTMTRIRI